MKNLEFHIIKKTKLCLALCFFTPLILHGLAGAETEIPHHAFLLKVDYIQDANSLQLTSGKKIRLAGINIPDFYGKNSQWIGLDEKTLYNYSSEAKEFVHNLIYQTEQKRKWFFVKNLKSQRLSRMIYIELEPANSKRKHKVNKRSKETFVYAYVLLPDDGSDSEDIMHYAMLPDAKYPKRKAVFINEALLRQGYGFATDWMAKSQYPTLKKAEEYARSQQTPGKSPQYSGLRVRAKSKDVQSGHSYELNKVRSGFQLYLENGLYLDMIGIHTPAPFGKNIRFTAPYGNLIQVAAKSSLNHLLTQLTDKESRKSLNSIEVQLDPKESKRKKSKKDASRLTAWVYSQDLNSNLGYINNCCEDRIDSKGMAPDWHTSELMPLHMLNLEMILSGYAYPLPKYNAQYQNLLNEAYQFARLSKENLHSDQFAELNYLSELTKTAKGKIAPTKRIGTPRRRKGGENNSWDGRSNFNG